MYSEKSQETFQRRWDRMYGLACRYYREHGDLLVPGDMVTPCGRRLGRWIGTQRLDARKGVHSFTRERQRKLEEIGMVWSVKEAAWKQMYRAACAYYRKEGHLRVPAQFVNKEDLALGAWIIAARQLYQAGAMSEQRGRMLERIEMVWSVKKEILSRWDDYYNQCEAYIEIHGGMLVPKRQKAADGKSLGEWLVRQKSAYRAGKLSSERSRKMERFAPAYTAKEYQWLAWFSVAEQFFQANGHLIVPPGTACHCGDLHAWVNTQRIQYTRGILDPQKAARLEKIRIVWRVRESSWERLFCRAEQYYRGHGDLMVPRNYKADPELSIWLTNQRKDRKQNRPTLTDQRIARLNAIGMSWEPFEKMWEEKYAQAKEYYEQNGHLVVKGERNSELRQWILQQRTAKKGGVLTEERKTRLDEIGMVWEVFEEHWERMYAAAVVYYRVHEQLNIPVNYVTPEGLYLGRWISGQRRTYKQLMAVDDPKFQRRFARLNEVNMIWDASKLVYFTSFQEQAVMYYVREHESDTVKMNSWEEYGIEIDVYLSKLRAGIEYDGIFHREKQESDARKDRICRKQNIRLLRIREPGLPPLPAGGEILYLMDQSPQSLDEAIHRALSMLGFPETDVDTERDRPAILEVYRNINSPAWDRMYEVAHRLFEECGSLDTHGRPQEETAAIRGWLTKQRRNYYDGLLTKRQVDKLMKLRFLDGAMPLRKKVHSAEAAGQEFEHTHFSQKERALQSVQKRERAARIKWEVMYAAACAYYKEKGNLLIPCGHIAEDDISLGKWITAQRRRYRDGTLTPLEIQKLESIMMLWEPKKQALR